MDAAASSCAELPRGIPICHKLSEPHPSTDLVGMYHQELQMCHIHLQLIVYIKFILPNLPQHSLSARSKLAGSKLNMVDPPVPSQPAWMSLAKYLLPPQRGIT